MKHFVLLLHVQLRISTVWSYLRTRSTRSRVGTTWTMVTTNVSNYFPIPGSRCTVFQPSWKRGKTLILCKRQLPNSATCLPCRKRCPDLFCCCSKWKWNHGGNTAVHNTESPCRGLVDGFVFSWRNSGFRIPLYYLHVLWFENSSLVFLYALEPSST